MAKKTTSDERIDISVSLNYKTISIPIRGVSPLIVNRFSEKAGKQIKEIGELQNAPKQGGKKKNIADPEEDYKNSLYYLSDGKSCGFPAGAIKDAMVTAGYRNYGLPMTTTRSSFHIVADDKAKNLVKINGEHRMREDMVRVGGMQKVASPRYRAEFPDWSAVVTIRFLDGVITERALVTLLAAAGFSCGLGEWRPEKCNSGSFGTFEVVSI